MAQIANELGKLTSMFWSSNDDSIDSKLSSNKSYKFELSLFELLKEVVQFLNTAHTPYMLTGSIVSSFQGEPRSTHDIDMMILFDKDNVNSLLNAFPPPTFYLDREMVLEGIRSKKMFKLLNTIAGDKIDFYPLPDNEYELVRFKRKIQRNLSIGYGSLERRS